VGPGIDMQANRLNRRKSERRLCKSFAKIQFGTNSLPRDCTITDMSVGGVKVIAEHLDALPPEFTIILSTGNPRQCRLAWRIGHEFGAEFVD
jgi:PilZ domain